MLKSVSTRSTGCVFSFCFCSVQVRCISEDNIYDQATTIRCAQDRPLKNAETAHENLTNHVLVFTSPQPLPRGRAFRNSDAFAAQYSRRTLLQLRDWLLDFGRPLSPCCSALCRCGTAESLVLAEIGAFGRRHHGDGRSTVPLISKSLDSRTTCISWKAVFN